MPEWGCKYAECGFKSKTIKTFCSYIIKAVTKLFTKRDNDKGLIIFNAGCMGGVKF